VQAGLLGDPWSAHLRLMRPDSVWLRHTVGLADRLEADDAGADPDDGLPATLQDAIACYGLRYFKLKLCGQPEADVARLSRIERLLARVGDYRVTLDGNETYADVAQIEALFDTLARHPATARLVQRTLLLEQPLPRHLALQQSLVGARIPVPVILDESDDDESVLPLGLAQGYRGISSKACKGIYRSLAHAARLRTRPGHLLSGEDLTCQAGLALQQDTLLAASLGVTHIERNGHHYVRGFGTASVAETQDFLSAHRGLYQPDPQGVRLRIQYGRLDLSSLHQPGFAHSATPHWDTLEPFTE
jgi:L-alanine-DL-glutamate epimerase-like enolase superfamily enzyme